MRGEAIYYALGGGLGHLTRARAVLATLGETARVICHSPHAANPEVTRGLHLLPVPPATAQNPTDFATWLETLLWESRPSIFYLDSFPAGLFGELCTIELPPDLRIHHLARLLRWENYRPLIGGKMLRLQRVYRLEPLAAEQQTWLQDNAGQIIELTLPLPPPGPLPNSAAPFNAMSRPRWLVVHSGPWDEVKELLDYARDMAVAEGMQPALALVTPVVQQPLPDNVLHLPLYPVYPLYWLADRIISACGFNVMREVGPYRDKHRFIPMPRQFDDQYARAGRFRRD